jgi:glycosyltransferase involved in cell wall biosynthesis
VCANNRESRGESTINHLRRTNPEIKDPPMRILMIAPEPFFEPRGTPFSILGRLQALSELGHAIDLVTYHLGEDLAIPNVTIHRIPRVRFIDHVDIGPSLKKLFLDVLVFAKAVRLLRSQSYDLIHSHEEAGFFGVFLAKRFRVRHLYDMHSSLPQQLINFKYTRSPLLIKLFESLERRAVGMSDAVITICPALSDHVRQIHSTVPLEMIENLSMGTDPRTVADEDLLKLKNDYSMNDKRVVFYSGTFESYQGLDMLVTAAARVLEKREDVVFLLAGGNPKQVQAYQAQVRDLGLEASFRFLGMRPPEEIPAALQLSHVLVSPRIRGTNTPLKIYTYLQSGKPIVATNIYTHTQVLDATVALLAEPDPDSFAQGILSVLDDSPLAVRLGTGARRLFESRYDYPSFLQKTERVLEMAMGRGPIVKPELDLSSAAG